MFEVKVLSSEFVFLICFLCFLIVAPEQKEGCVGRCLLLFGIALEGVLLNCVGRLWDCVGRFSLVFKIY